LAHLEIKWIDPMSFAKIEGAIGATVGFVIGLFVTVFGTIFAGPFGAVGGIVSIIVLPIGYGLVGLVAGYLMGIVYNFAAKKIGGIKVKT